eukprot:4189606-Heterocapsa_arctica.AAC.1
MSSISSFAPSARRHRSRPLPQCQYSCPEPELVQAPAAASTALGRAPSALFLMQPGPTPLQALVVAAVAQGA